MAKPDSCLGCPLYEDGEGFVPGEGPTNPRMMFVGEAPGEDEATWGRPFIGGSGRVLTKQMYMCGLNRKEMYITNVVKCRPPKNRTPTAQEIQFCSQYLKAELKAVQTNLIVAVGDTAARALTGRRLNEVRGVPVMVGGRKVLTMFHPAFIMRQQELWPVALFDLNKAKRECLTPEVRIVETHYNIGGRIQDLGPAILDVARKAGFITFDIETEGANALDPTRSQVICVGLGSEVGHASSFYWTLETAAFVRAVASDPDIEKIGQNSEGFDIPYLEGKGVEFKGRTFDTMLAFHLTNSDLPKDLGFIGSFYMDIPNWKNDKGDLLLYNARDVDATTRSALGLKRELRSMGMEKLYDNVMHLQPVLRSMTRLGLKKNEAKAMHWAQAIRAKCYEKEKILQQELGFSFNVQSPQQMMDLLYNKLGLPVQYTKDPKTKEMRPTANAKAIERLVEISNNPILHQIADIRSAYTTCSTFLDVEADERGFVHPKFACAKAANGRLNCTDPNAQNIPQVLREIYEPDSEEEFLIEADWSQIEWRLQVLLSGDPVGLQLLTSGLDNHRAVAAEVEGVPYDQVTDEQRHRAKFVVHGLGYGRGAASIAAQYKQPVATIEAFIERFKNRFNVFWTERDRWKDFVGKHAYLANPFGRRRWWYTRQVTEIYNFKASSTAADMMYIILPMLHRQLPKGATVRASIHDAVLINAPKDAARETWQCVKDIMNTVFPEITEHSANPAMVRKFYPNGWSCPSDIHAGMNWKECKKGNKELEKYLGLVT